MPRIPFIGRLNISEYLALVGSFFLVGLEAFIRVFTLLLPTSILALLYRASRRLFNQFTPPKQRKSVIRRKSISTSIRDASDFVDLCALFGYYAEEHVVQTSDGYLLGLHRLGWRKGEEDVRVNSGKHCLRKRVVYLHHGLLMNSEVWVCLTDEQRCLPFVLVDKGYDVWLGNNRGNKYSKKCIHCPPTSTSFWNFSMDEFAFHDIPESINYVLTTTAAASLSYIGFSQGTAQAFATLAVHPTLNEKIDVFIALAPAMSPAGLSNGIVDALIKASPQVLFLMFGRRSILNSATMWQSILYPPIFVKVIDMGLSFLFNWQAKNISTSQKLAAYPHLYSFTSTKSVVHWFQIIRTKSFQMYDDDVLRPLSISSVSKYTKVAKFPTRNIKTPIVLIYGGSDSLVDINVMLKELPSHTVATEIPHYEHLDLLWAREVDILVFPHVIDALESFTNAEHTKEDFEKFREARHTLIVNQSQPPPIYASEDERTPMVSTHVGTANITPTKNGGALTSTRSRATLSSGIPSLNGRRRKLHSEEDSSSSTSPKAPIKTGRATEDDGPGDDEPSSPAQSQLLRTMRGSSIGSSISFDTPRLRGKGIALGVGKAAGGVVSRGLESLHNLTSSDTDSGVPKGGSKGT